MECCQGDGGLVSGRARQRYLRLQEVQAALEQFFYCCPRRNMRMRFPMPSVFKVTCTWLRMSQNARFQSISWPTQNDRASAHNTNTLHYE
jgi:hypothetical protein